METSKIQKTVVATAVALAAGAGGIAVHDAGVPAFERTDHFIRGDVTNAEQHRKYLTERMAYMLANQEREDIPQPSVESAIYAYERFEDYLERKQFTNGRVQPVRRPPQRVIDMIANRLSLAEVMPRAYAVFFGMETFETGTSPWSFTAEEGWGASDVLTLATTSVLEGTNSIKIDPDEETSRVLRYDFGSDKTEVYIQYEVLYPSSYTWSADGYSGTFELTDNSGDQRIRINHEDWFNPQITVAGDVAYTPTGLLDMGTQYRFEMYIRKHATDGIIRVWRNNSVEGDPDFEATGINTGAAAVRNLRSGAYYSPGAVDEWFFDNVVIADQFIGDGIAEEDTCTPTTGEEWQVDLADNCNITTSIFHDAGLACSGVGSFTVASGTGIVRVASSTCPVQVKGGGVFIQ